MNDPYDEHHSLGKANFRQSAVSPILLFRVEAEDREAAPIRKLGDTVIISPKTNRWDEFFAREEKKEKRRHNADPSLYIWYRFFGLANSYIVRIRSILVERRIISQRLGSGYWWAGGGGSQPVDMFQ